MKRWFDRIFTLGNFLKLLGTLILLHETLDLFFEINLKNEFSYPTKMFISGILTTYFILVIIKFLEDKLRIGVRSAEE